jgi:hypothetical protein
MGKCYICGKKLGVLEGYETFDKEFCKECYLKQGEKKIEKKKEETEQERKEKEDMKKLLWGDKEKMKNMTKAEKIRAWALWLVIFIVLMASLKILGWF